MRCNGRTGPADADDARGRCVEWGRLRRPMLIMLASIVLNVGPAGHGAVMSVHVRY